MRAIGLDIGGTKIEAQVFDADWQVSERRRIATPTVYVDLVTAVAEQIAWAEAVAGARPIGISSAGLINPATGLALTANLCATGKPFPADIEAASGRRVTFVNDCRAFTLSEATLGAGREAASVAGLILGTGVGGGFALGGRLIGGHANVGGEFGHAPLPADLIVRYDLPVVACGCGRTGCVETLVSGPGLTRIADRIAGRPLTPIEIVEARQTDDTVARVWAIWCELVAEVMMLLVTTVDPEVIVLGGGLSNIPEVTADLTQALDTAQISGFASPRILLAQGGDASGARGAAIAAWQEIGQ